MFDEIKLKSNFEREKFPWIVKIGPRQGERDLDSVPRR
jgi:hypothetical protein